MTAGLATIFVAFSFLYGIRLLALSRRRRSPSLPPPDDLLFVFLMPCLNEESVIGRSLDRLMAIPGDNFTAMVIDDASDDGTAEVVRHYDRERVWLFQRSFPDARKGKGEALNAAYRFLCATELLADRDPRSVIIVVVDADGRLARNALIEVAPFFRDPQVGGVQIGVRMYNARDKLLARMQDMEFVTFTEIFQRARQKIGSVGLGGNGQFTRLSALQSLGPAPWTDCLTEDLDLGIQLLTHGWINCYCPTSHVSQEAVVQLHRLIRQRARWYQGHIQCWSRIPDIVRSGLPPLTVVDLVCHLVAASLVVVMGAVSLAFLIALILTAVVAPSGLMHILTSHDGLPVMAFYLLSFGLSPIYGAVYWLRDPDSSLIKTICYAHLFTVYAYIWVPAGWRALWRLASGRRDWAKTARSVEIVRETHA